LISQKSNFILVGLNHPHLIHSPKETKLFLLLSTYSHSHCPSDLPILA